MNYEERADAAWDELSLGEKLHELDEDSVRDFAASLGLEDWCENPDLHSFERTMRKPGAPTPGELWRVLSVMHRWCKEHKRFTAWFEREVERQKQLDEEPDDWEDER